MDKPNVFQFFHKTTPVELTNESGETLLLLVANPTSRQIDQGNKYLFQRAKYWMEEKDAEIARQTEEFVKSLPSKEHMIEALIQATVRDRVDQNMDLVDPLVRKASDYKALSGLSGKEMTLTWGSRMGESAARIEEIKQVKGKDLTREDVRHLLKDPEAMEIWLDSLLRQDITQRLLERERETYGGRSEHEIRDTLSFVNQRTLSYTYAQEEYIRFMITMLTFYPDAAGKPAEKVFSMKEEDDNFVGNAHQELLRSLAKAVMDFLGMSNMPMVRRAAESPDFLPSTTSPGGSGSRPQVAENTPMS